MRKHGATRTRADGRMSEAGEWVKFEVTERWHVVVAANGKRVGCWVSESYFAKHG